MIKKMFRRHMMKKFMKIFTLDTFDNEKEYDTNTTHNLPTKKKSKKTLKNKKLRPEFT